MTRLYSITAVCFFLASVGCGGSLTPVDDTEQRATTRNGNSGGAGTATATLDDGETAHLIFMREEEKLARDVYLTFAAWYPDYTVFHNIATLSEQTHTDKILSLLDKYGIADPNPDTNNLPDAIGVFTGEDYGPYFSMKYTELTTIGSKSVLDALYVGALIEELDMDDIVNCPKEIVSIDSRAWPAPMSIDNGIDEGECGLLHTDQKDITTVYENILDGSKSHLRSFVKNIETFIGEGNYVAQYITQQEVDEILGR
jgi:hypothetical protein